MEITYQKSTKEDIKYIYDLCKNLIDTYETISNIDYDKVLNWVHRKIEKSIDEYTTVFADGVKIGYYHFFKNKNGQYEIDDLYIFPKYQCKGVGSQIIQKCYSAVSEPVFLYVFIKNQRAYNLYKRHGFEVVETLNNTRYIMKRDNNFN